ncbi:MULTISPECIES: DUF736 domain-containing protein [Acetobacteraceae]|uniref:DUF736 domain-containing protein n=1 Tax=Acetobacteraceae TaxID=433 RepID=UPI001BAB726C|nr:MULTISPECIES: DUF736 domain-containing protein [Acetobacteraceae]MBS0963797.1 DUF736 domain-containing protein [Acetobacter persici]MDF3626095.1 DUF736 domain-containing protein [Brytella acorum]
MAQIGTFTRTSDGFAGRLRTLALDVELTIVPATSSDVEHAPDYRVHLGDADAGPEIGAGWKRTGEKAGTYLSLVLDDPTLAQPIRANLFQSDRQGRAFHLVWNRPVKRDDRR